MNFTFKIDGEASKISDVDRELIKTNIVQLMLNSPSSIQKQLSDAISIIGREDFPEKWKNLLGVRFLVMLALICICYGVLGHKACYNSGIY